MTLVNLDDTFDVQLTNLAAQYYEDDMYNEDQRGLFYPRAFLANATGTLCITPVGNAVGHSVPVSVVAGSVYPIAARRFMSTGTTGISDGEIVAIR